MYKSLQWKRIINLLNNPTCMNLKQLCLFLQQPWENTQLEKRLNYVTFLSVLNCLTARIQGQLTLIFYMSILYSLVFDQMKNIFQECQYLIHAQVSTSEFAITLHYSFICLMKKFNSSKAGGEKQLNVIFNKSVID